MCCTLLPSEMTGTFILSHQVLHEGKRVNVLAYQNTAKSYEPNVMVLPIPSKSDMGSANLIDMSDAPSILKEYASRLRPRTRGRSVVASAGGGSFDVFTSGSYTVVLTKNLSISGLKEAMAQVPEKFRIEIDLKTAKWFTKYKNLYPGFHLALCFWDGEVEAEPMLWWYEPLEEYRERHFIPGLDAHDGNPPRSGPVKVDHHITLGTVFGENCESVLDMAPEHLRKWLPKRAVGYHGYTILPNGDWDLPRAPAKKNHEWFMSREEKAGL